MLDPQFNVEGKPLRIQDLNIEKLAALLHSKNIRTVQGKQIQPLHSGHLKVISDPARYKVLACGRRWGKCRDITDTLTLSDGSIATFGELINKNFKVFSYDENHNVIETDAYCVDNGIKPVYKIKTKTGLELSITSNHPLFTAEGWKTLDEGLSTGDKIFTPSQLPQEGKDKKDPKLLQLLAYLLSDGCISQKTYSFSNDNKIIQENFIACLDGTHKIILSKVSKKGNVYKEYRLHKNNSIYKLIEELGLHGSNSHTKFIPNWVYTSPNEQIALFLNRLFSCDGWASFGEIGYCSVSKKLATDVKRLLARLGIISYLKTKKLKSGRWAGNTAYQIKIINTSEQLKFKKIIGILGKELALRTCIVSEHNSFNSQLETIPKEFCESFQRKLINLISTREQEKLVGRVRGDRANNRNRLIFYSTKFKEEFKEEKKILDMPGYWDEVVEITYLGEKRTAGLTVPKYHNYISDCLEHNTLLTSIIALAVLMQTNRRVWIVAPDYSLCEKVFRELYSILVRQLKLINPGKQGRARNQKGDYYLETPWGSVLEAKSMENPDALAGEANDLVIIDEAALTPNVEDIWTQMIKPTLMDKQGSAIFISTPRGRNSFYRLFLNGKRGSAQRDGKLDITFNPEAGVDDDMRDWSSFQETSYDNPMLSSDATQSKKEIDDAYREAIMSGKAVKFRQEYLADFESVEDICFPGFVMEANKKHPNPNVVNYKWHPDEGPVFAACDHNYAKPASTIFAQINKWGDVVVFDEKFTPRTTSYMQAQQILDKQNELNARAIEIWKKEGSYSTRREHIKLGGVVADISGDQRQLSGRKAWDDFEAVLGYRPKGLSQDRETGCNMMRLWLQHPEFDSKGRPKLDENRQPLTHPKLFITKNCTQLIFALQTAIFKKSKGGGLKEDYEETVEGHEGLLDALRYLLVYLFHDSGNHFAVIQGAN